MADTNIEIDLSELTNLTDESRIIITLGSNKFYLKPVTLPAFSEYTELEKEDADKAKFFLVGMCLTKPNWSREKLVKQPIGLITTLFNNLLRASFLLTPESLELLN